MNRAGETPLFLAGHLECVKFILEHGADVNLPNLKESSPLDIASRMGHTLCVRALLKADANINQTDIFGDVL